MSDIVEINSQIDTLIRGIYDDLAHGGTGFRCMETDGRRVWLSVFFGPDDAIPGTTRLFKIDCDRFSFGDHLENSRTCGKYEVIHEITSGGGGKEEEDAFAGYAPASPEEKLAAGLREDARAVIIPNADILRTMNFVEDEIHDAQELYYETYAT